MPRLRLRNTTLGILSARHRPPREVVMPRAFRSRAIAQYQSSPIIRSAISRSTSRSTGPMVTPSPL